MPVIDPLEARSTGHESPYGAQCALVSADLADETWSQQIQGRANSDADDRRQHGHAPSIMGGEPGGGKSPADPLAVGVQVLPGRDLSSDGNDFGAHA